MHTSSSHSLDSSAGSEVPVKCLVDSARKVDLYNGPNMEDLPFVAQQRLLNLLRSHMANAETSLAAWRIECRASSISHSTNVGFESILYQRDHDEPSGSPALPEGYEYTGHGRHVVLRVVDRASGNESYPGAIAIFSALLEALTKRIPHACAENRGTMHSYDIYAAILPVEASELNA